jgi:hypothetical protein
MRSLAVPEGDLVPLAVIGDPGADPFQPICLDDGGELAALVGVQDPGRAEAVDGLGQRLDEVVCLNHKLLDEAALFAWWDKVGLWPDGTEPTLDYEEPGIGAGAIDATAKETQREAEERAARAGSVRVNDRDIDPEHAD